MSGTITAIGAHHDDVELRAGGVLSKYAKNGWKVVYAIASTTPHYNPLWDDKDSEKYLSNNEVINLRKKEAEQGAEILGASEIHFLDYKSIYWYRENSMDRVYLDGINCTSGDLEYLEREIPGREFLVSAHRVEHAVEFMAGFISDSGADIVLTHSPDDVHWEHYATAALVLKAVRNLHAKGDKPRLYGWEFGSCGTLSFGFHPSRFVDITDTIDIKCRALGVFKSQFEDAGVVAERARARAKGYGKICGYDFAEPFVDFNVERIDAGKNLALSKTFNPSHALKGLE